MIKFTEVHKTILEACLISKQGDKFTNDFYLPHLYLIDKNQNIELNSAVLELIQYGVLKLAPGVTDTDLRLIKFTNDLYPELLRLFYKPNKAFEC